MSAVEPWLDAPVVDEDPEPWKKAPIVEDPEQPWLSAPIVEEAATGTQPTGHPDRADELAHTPLSMAEKEGFFESTTPADLDEAAKWLTAANPNALSPSVVESETGGDFEDFKTHPDLAHRVMQAPLINLPKPENTGVATGIARGVIQSVEGLATAENAAIGVGVAKAPTAIQKLASLGFSGMMIKGAAGELANAPDGETPGEKSERITRGIVALLMGGFAAKHAASGSPVPISATERTASMERAREQVSNAGAEAGPQATTTRPAPDAAAPAPISPVERIAEPAGVESARTPAGEALTESPATRTTTPATEAAPTPAESLRQPQSAQQVLDSSLEVNKGAEVRSTPEQGVGAKLGPGAANIEEPLTRYEERRFSKRFDEDTSITQEVRDATGNRYYEPIPNKLTVGEAEAIIERRGTDESVRLVRDETFPMEPRVRSTMAQGLIKKLNQSYEEAKKANDPKAQEFLTQAADTAEYLGDLGTKLGQGVQAFSIWSRLTPEGMLMAAQRTVKKGLTEFDVKNGDAVQQVLDAVNTAPPADRLQVLIRLSKDNIIAQKLKGDFERLVDAAKGGDLTKDKFYKLMSDKLGVPSLTPEQTAKITDLANEINKTPEGFQRDEKTRDLLSYISEIKGANPADIPTSLWYANILSGYSTQLVNTLDTAVNVMSESAAMAAANPKAAPQILTGLYQGLLKGVPDAAYVLKEGKGRAENKLKIPGVLERTKFGEKGGVPIRPTSALTSVMKAALESKPAKVLNIWKFPLRAMMASDTVFYNTFKEARARVLADAIGRREGLSGDALFRRVDEILNTRPQDRAAAEQTAAGEGLTGLKAKKRVSEILEQRRPDELVSNADEAAGIATYNHDPQGTLGMIASHLATVADNVPGGKFVVPFTRIVANVTSRGLDYTPYGYKRLFFGRGGGKRFAEDAPVGEAYRMQLAKATAGTIGMAAVAALDAGGQIQITANGPEDSDEKNQLRAAGWKPFSVKIGDTYYSYQNTPFGLGFSIVGQYRDAVRYNKLNQKDAQTRLAYALMHSGKSITDMSFLSGLSDFMDIINAKGTSSKSATNFLSRTASSIVVPNIIKQVTRLFDPKAYQADTIQAALIRDTPIAAMALKPQLNMLGEPVELSTNRFTSADKKDPVWSMIVDKQAWIPVPSKTAKIRNKPITPEQYYTLIEKSGPKIRNYIQSNLSRFKGMEAEKVQQEISNQANAIRAAVKSSL